MSAGAPPARDALIAAFAARQHALVTIEQLRAAGLTDGAVTKRVGRGLLYRRYRGVYVVGQPKLSEDGERMAAVLAAGPGAALSHIALAELRGISRFRDRTVHVSAPRFR
jgi:predicted transcriptional regulator of viral defense system